MKSYVGYDGKCATPPEQKPLLEEHGEWLEIGVAGEHLELIDTVGQRWEFYGFAMDASHDDGRLSVEGFVRPISRTADRDD